ncbi:hypothetical protein DLM75_13640 [Leptospira stimsonii]|uniref:Uncharacterized protein n=1 Tax=Leptospira stimsonii TaxID=2202203 RepID=A0A396Z3E2_9LEPT|nr:hypothetical protein DLM75_13640 [Leptospira stimsonii]
MILIWERRSSYFSKGFSELFKNCGRDLLRKKKESGKRRLLLFELMRCKKNETIVLLFGF